MGVYLISEVIVRDAEALAKYRDLAAVTHAKFGGRYVVRGGETNVIEGDRAPGLMIIVEFPDKSTVLDWYASPEYAEALKYRDAAFESRSLILVEGFTPPP